MPRELNSGSRCESVQVLQGSLGPPARCAGKPVSARTRWNLFGACGVVQRRPVPSGRRDRLHPSSGRHLRPSGPPARGRAPSSNPSPVTGRPGSPVPFESVPRACWRRLVARRPGPTGGLGQQTGRLAFFALPARLALTADLVLRPQRCGPAHCARRAAPSGARSGDL